MVDGHRLRRRVERLLYAVDARTGKAPLAVPGRRRHQGQRRARRRAGSCSRDYARQRLRRRPPLRRAALALRGRAALLRRPGRERRHDRDRRRRRVGGGARRRHRRRALAPRGGGLRLLLARDRGRDACSSAPTPAASRRSTWRPARLRWSFAAGERISGSATVVGDVVYTAVLARPGAPRRTYGLDVDTGAVRFRAAEGRYSPVVAAGVDPLPGGHPDDRGVPRPRRRKRHPDRRRRRRRRRPDRRGGARATASRRGGSTPAASRGRPSGFEPQQAPTGSETAGSWPEWGFDAGRTRANPALDIAPPFRRLWSLRRRLARRVPAGDRRRPRHRGHQLRPGVRARHRHREGGLAGAHPRPGGLVAGDRRHPRALHHQARRRPRARQRAPARSCGGAGSARAIESSPLVVGSRSTSGRSRGGCMKLSTRTGGVRWSVPAPGRHQGQPRPLRPQRDRRRLLRARRRRSGGRTEGRCGAAPAPASGSGAPGASTRAPPSRTGACSSAT